MNPEIKDLIQADGHDKWSYAMGTWFAITDVLTADGWDVPLAWEYQTVVVQGETVEMLADNVDGSTDYTTEVLAGMLRSGKINVSDLVHAGNVLMRYTALLRAAGLSY
jgi:hypothetical protein